VTTVDGHVSRGSGQGPRASDLTFTRPPAGSLGPALRTAAELAEQERWVERLWARDASLWTSDQRASESIGARLGWLDAADRFQTMTAELSAFAERAKESFTAAVLAGMGGSSLAPALFGRVFAPAGRGVPLHVLDSTDPAAVAAIDSAASPADTLYLIATKSGTTAETLSFLAYFLERVGETMSDQHHGALDRMVEAAHPGPERWVADHFVAITDPGESVARLPWSDRFREVFLNPPDVGGRYSALTYVGLVPAALVGADLDALLRSGVAMANRCRERRAAANPGLALGLAMGALARAGRDKLTLVLDPRIAALGPWIEQLVAESTGKQGRGIVPVEGEAIGPPEAYGPDRFFVAIRLESPADDVAPDGDPAMTDDRLEALAGAGHPVAVIRLRSLEGLGGEFFRWEFATAIAGAILGVDPFDEPDVAEAKRNTERVLREGPPRPAAIAADDAGLAGRLAEHRARVPEAGYLAVTAFIAPTPERDAALSRIRLALRDATRRATTVGYGPRYLHSTGQLHKGGPPTGWFLQLVAGHPQDLPIPDADHSFGALIDAQADGDLTALASRGRPILRVHLGDDPDAGLRALESAVARSLA
jgi:glucose-6-phosphate isomerase